MNHLENPDRPEACDDQREQLERAVTIYPDSVSIHGISDGEGTEKQHYVALSFEVPGPFGPQYMLFPLGPECTRRVAQSLVEAQNCCDKENAALKAGMN